MLYNFLNRDREGRENTCFVVGKVCLRFNDRADDHGFRLMKRKRSKIRIDRIYADSRVRGSGWINCPLGSIVFDRTLLSNCMLSGIRKSVSIINERKIVFVSRFALTVF